MAEPRFKSWPYTVTVVATTTPVTLAETKEWLRIESADEADDPLITALIKACTVVAEKAMNRDLITRTYATTRNGFSDCVANITGGDAEIELRRAPFFSTTAVIISYLVDGAPTALVQDTDFYANSSVPYPNLTPITTWPTDGDDKQNSVTITFVNGFGEAETDVPQDIRDAIKSHVNAIYENRGDSEKSDPSVLPAFSKMVYDQNKIISL